MFDASDDCTIVHSALYSCLRAVFGLSVAGVLVAVFSCMLVYQLLSHERKKMYWEQLELRCRSLYGPPTHPGPPPPLSAGPAAIDASRNMSCRCCEQCHSHRNMLQPAFGWETDGRMWANGPGGNFYGPNPARGDEHMLAERGNRTNPNRAGWSWPRFPWQRNDSNQRFRRQPSSPDSQYGFSNNTSSIMPQATSYAMINGNIQHYGIWGPPPPYSDPNSPARRNRYFGLQTQCTPMNHDHPNLVQTMPPQQPIHQNPVLMECHAASIENHNYVIEQNGMAQIQAINRQKKPNAYKLKESHDDSLSSEQERRDIQSNTLPFRKAKKRNEVTTKSIHQQVPSSRVNIRYVFNSAQDMIEETNRNEGASSSNDNMNSLKKRNPNSVENNAFNLIEHDNKSFTMNESEIYFGDTSSCCNNTAKNVNFHERSLDEQRQTLTPNRLHLPNKPEYIKLNSDNKNQSNRRNAPQIPKDQSRQSMCSMDSGEKTDYTDLSPLTPTTPIGGRTETTSRLNSHFNRPTSYYNEPSSSTSHLTHNNYQRNTRKYNEVHLSAEILVDNSNCNTTNRSRESHSACNSLNGSMRSRQNNDTSHRDISQYSINHRINSASNSHNRNDRTIKTNSRCANENEIDLMFIDNNSDSEEDTGNVSINKNDRRL